MMSDYYSEFCVFPFPVSSMLTNHDEKIWIGKFLRLQKLNLCWCDRMKILYWNLFYVWCTFAFPWSWKFQTLPSHWQGQLNVHVLHRALCVSLPRFTSPMSNWETTDHNSSSDHNNNPHDSKMWREFASLDVTCVICDVMHKTDYV